MKIFLCCFLIGMSWQVLGQDIAIIDKSDETSLLFDASNPHSLLGLINAKNSYFIRKATDGIQSTDFDRLGIRKEEADKIIGMPGTVPIIDQDPNSPNFGENLIYTHPVYGYQSFLYDPPDTIYFTTQNVNRILVELDTSFFKKSVSTIVLAIHENDTTIPVLTIKGLDLFSLNGFSFVRDFSPEETKSLSSLDSNAYFGRTKQRTEGEYGLSGLDFFPENNNFIRFNYNTRLFSFDPELNWDYKFYGWEDSLDDFEDSIQRYFSSANFQKFKGTVPLINEDPNSPNFGENLVTVDSVTGISSFVYDPPSYYLYWLDFQPKFIAFEKIERNEQGEMVSKITSMHAMVEKEGVNSMVFWHKLNYISGEDEKTKEILSKFSDPTYWKDWRLDLEQIFDANGRSIKKTSQLYTSLNLTYDPFEM